MSLGFFGPHLGFVLCEAPSLLYFKIANTPHNSQGQACKTCLFTSLQHHFVLNHLPKSSGRINILLPLVFFPSHLDPYIRLKHMKSPFEELKEWLGISSFFTALT